MAASKMIGDLELKRLEELKLLGKKFIFIYPEELNNSEDNFGEATEKCLAGGYFIACTTKIMPTKRSGWKSEKGRDLKFRVPDGTDLSNVLVQFDAGELTVIVLQTEKHHVSFISRLYYKFLDDIVPDKLNPQIVNGSVNDLVNVMEKFCEAPQKQSTLPSRRQPAPLGRGPKAVQPELIILSSPSATGDDERFSQGATNDSQEKQPSSDMEVDDSLIEEKKRKKPGPKSTFDLITCLVQMDRLIQDRKDKGKRFPTALECAQQAAKKTKSHVSTIRNKTRKWYHDRYNRACRRGELDRHKVFIK
ncbi:hypothetical protein AYL99_11975 [Fonsecaea erecta]|uniref:Uncharacterized protein n=1 Tax=Fonsecaea erecta TaxID=1367422 RepID=A0A178Z1Z3_9EURO|nr:hypothetical protein AYL99_11975 [Fonsecaea erecta]OAP53818.1 hypothetical protein AYL99_11975 [Fonsecaea erecta]